MDWFVLLTLVVIGFTACSEFGSYAFVHPVIRELPPQYRLQVERGLLKTFGRVMPVLMTLSTSLAIAYAISARGLNTVVVLAAVLGALFGAIALISTIILNVPINLATGKWNPKNPPADWQQKRATWEWAQGVRSWLYLLEFIAIAISLSGRIGG